ncbi:MAG: hypothetical protein IID15_08750 [Candidatus Marinimicrobia bacterium]|nr:hypothetical protein [Candidatus Neomarinimicrobiota bacterium]
MALALWCATAISLVLGLFEPLVESFAILTGRSRAKPDHAIWPLLVAAGITTITLIWQHFVVPVLGSAEVRFKDRRMPRMMLRNFWLSLWMPLIVGVIICVTNLIPVYLGRMTLGKWLEIQPWILYVAFALPFLAIPPLLLMKPVLRRLKVNAHQQSRCFECGYNLTGVWSDNCPECGTGRRKVTTEVNVTNASNAAS